MAFYYQELRHDGGAGVSGCGAEGQRCKVAQSSPPLKKQGTLCKRKYIRAGQIVSRLSHCLFTLSLLFLAHKRAVQMVRTALLTSRTRSSRDQLRPRENASRSSLPSVVLRTSQEPCVHPKSNLYPPILYRTPVCLLKGCISSLLPRVTHPSACTALSYNKQLDRIE